MLRRHLCLLVAILPGLTVARTEHNSFLEHRVSTVKQLVASLADPVVRDRYVRHFGKSRAELSTWFRTLHIGHLPQGGEYWVYNADDRGVIRAKNLKLRTGVPIFLDARNRPVLKVSCGNPMRPGSDLSLTPIRRHEEGDLSDMKDRELDADSLLAEENLLPTEPELMASVDADIPAFVAEIPADVLPWTTLPAAPGGFSLLPTLGAPIVGIGLPIIAGQLPHSRSPGPLLPVPEPSSLAAMAGAIAGLSLLRRRKESAKPA